MKERYEESKAFIKTFLLDPQNGMISCTSDGWTSTSADGYISMTLHVIRNWKLYHFLLAFKEIPLPHDAVNIAQGFLDIFEAYGITRLILSIVLDNASVNEAALRHYRNLLAKKYGADRKTLLHDELMHGRCFAHIVALIVKCCLEYLLPFLSKLRENNKTLRWKPVQQFIFQHALESFGNYEKDFKGRKWPSRDVCTRWNTTTEMCESTIPYKEVYARWFAATSGSNCAELSDDEWRNSVATTQLLASARDATVVASGSNYPTIHLILGLVCELKMHIEYCLATAEEVQDAIVTEACESMLDKFGKYFDEMPFLYVIAAVLDPKLKFAFVEHCFNANPEKMTELGDKLNVVCSGFEDFHQTPDSGLPRSSLSWRRRRWATFLSFCRRWRFFWCSRSTRNSFWSWRWRVCFFWR